MAHTWLQSSIPTALAIVKSLATVLYTNRLSQGTYLTAEFYSNRLSYGKTLTTVLYTNRLSHGTALATVD